MKPLGWLPLVISCAGAAALTWTGYAVGDVLGWSLPSVPLVAAALLGGVAVVIGWLAHLTRGQVAAAVLAPERAVARLALARAAMVGGAALAGGYLGIGIHAIPRLVAPAPQERAWGALAGLIAAVGLAWAGASLEKACRVPDPPENDAATPKDDPGIAGHRR